MEHRTLQEHQTLRTQRKGHHRSQLWKSNRGEIDLQPHHVHEPEEIQDKVDHCTDTTDNLLKTPPQRFKIIRRVC